MKTTREIAKTVVAETLTHGGILVEPTVLHAANRWLVASIESALQQAIADERALCVQAAREARLPKGYQWGHDAMEQFNFGKERAALAIKNRK